MVHIYKVYRKYYICLLYTSERETLISQGIDCTTMVIILNQSEFSDIKCMTGGAVVAGQNTVIEVIK